MKAILILMKKPLQKNKIGSFIFIIALVLLSMDNLNANWIKPMVFNEQEITLKKGMVTTISFSSLLNFFVVGDEVVLLAEKINNNTLALSPKIANTKTNINVWTTQGNYVFVVNSVDYDDSIEPTLHISVGKGAFNNQEKLDKKLNKELKKLEQNPNLDYDFNMYSKWFCGLWFCDYKKIAPSRVWSDGQYTYLDYTTTDGTQRTIPNILEVVDGIDIPVNKIIKDNVIVVHTLAKTITIVANGAYVCIEYVGDKYEIK